MAFHRDGDKITLTITTETWQATLFLLATLFGYAIQDTDKNLAWATARVLNRINEGNDRFQPYAIPPEYQDEGMSKTDSKSFN